MNEFFILITVYHFFCFTDFVLDSGTKDQIGISLIAFTVLNLGINLLFVTIDSFSLFLKKYKRKYREWKFRRDIMNLNKRKILLKAKQEAAYADEEEKR
jgi:hypothetical protein